MSKSKLTQQYPCWVFDILLPVPSSTYGRKLQLKHSPRRCPQLSNSFPLAISLALCQHVDMVCVYCNGKTKVTNSRPQKRLGQTWRRHVCSLCGAIFTTVEAPDLSGSLRFVARDGTLLPFERDVLFVSITQALGHRTDAVAAAGALTATITARLLKTAQSSRIARIELISMVETTLKHFDKASAVQYLAYHPR